MNGHVRPIAVALCVWILIVPVTVRSQEPKCTIEASEWSPRGTARTARPRIVVTFTSTCGSAIDPKSVQATIDDEVVKATVEGAGPKLTVVHTPESPLVEEEDHTVVVKVRDAKEIAGEKSWTFRVGDTYSR